MSEFDVMATAASAMAAQRAALSIAARNVAAAQTGGTPGRLEATFELVRDDAGVPLVREARPRLVPGRPADAITEMVAVLDAQRAFETNVSVFSLAKRLCERTIEAGAS